MFPCALLTIFVALSLHFCALLTLRLRPPYSVAPSLLALSLQLRCPYCALLTFALSLHCALLTVAPFLH